MYSAIDDDPTNPMARMRGSVSRVSTASLLAVTAVEPAGGKARLDEKLRKPHRHRRVALGRLEDEGVAAGERRGELPHRDHGREIERRDAGDHPERLAHGIKVDA